MPLIFESTVIVLIQLIIILLCAIAIGLWLRHFPYPSPLIRPLLPSRKRWPELQIRGWLQNGGFAAAFLSFFTRDPDRSAPYGADILAPADGLLTSMESRNGIRYIVIALSFWDVHVQRSPLQGSVVKIDSLGDTHTDGEGRNFIFLSEKKRPVQTRIIIDTSIGFIAIRLITSLAARRIETWINVGDRIERGQRIGRILLGSTVVLELPERYKIDVAHLQRVWAGETILCRIEHTK